MTPRVRKHLSGRDDLGREFVMGVYPMLLDETCHFLAADFDGENWQADASAFLETCRQLDLPAALERSRSGNGGHVWLFFDEAISACLARKLGAHLLTETMERRPEIGLGSYDRFFPNQDTLPKGGFGNLIALPLQKQARESGNTVFLDDAFTAALDQWSFLASVKKIGRERVEALVRDAEHKGRVVGVRVAAEEEDGGEPWAARPSRRQIDPPIAGPLPEKLEVVLADQIYFERENLPPALRNRLLRLAAFQNPEFYRAQAMRLPTYDKPRIIHCAEEHPKHYALPRGCLDEVLELLRSLKIKPIVRDERFKGVPLDVTFHGTLRPEQRLAAEAMLRHDTGVLAATTAFGKTVLAAWLIAHAASILWSLCIASSFSNSGWSCDFSPKMWASAWTRFWTPSWRRPACPPGERTQNIPPLARKLRIPGESFAPRKKLTIPRDFLPIFREQWAKMKVLRVPWIRCRADEIGAQLFEMRSRKQSFNVLAYSEQEAREWWSGLSDAERNDGLGIRDGDSGEQTSLF